MSELLLMTGLGLIVFGLWWYAPPLALVVGGLVVCAYALAWELRRRQQRAEAIRKRGG